MSRSTNYFGVQQAKGKENVCNPAIKVRFSKKLGMFVRTWFTIERDPITFDFYFKQHNAFHKDRSADLHLWLPKPSGNLS